METSRAADAGAGRQGRALLVLARASNLPTVWSNCAAAWWLAGGGGLVRFLCVLAGASLLYVGGMFLNDAFDADFDRRHRPERPIPSGIVSPKEVWFYGVFWLILGLFCVIWISSATAVLGLALVAAILVYDAIHKLITFAPALMAFCRFLLFLMAASAAAAGVTGLALWSALVLAAYIIGLSNLARKESVRGPFSFWPCLLLALPVLLAWFVNDGEYRLRFYLLSLLLLLWVGRCLGHTYRTPAPNLGRTVSGLLAGIVLVDLLAVGGPNALLSITFLLLFAGALLFQRFIPAT
jgi:hypothetical protein